MLKLIRTDLIFNRKNLLIILAITTAILAWVSWRSASIFPRAYFIVASFYVGATMSVTFIAREDRFKTGALVCSLPVRRRTVVDARFLLSWILMIFSLVYAAFIAAVLPFSRVDIALALNIKFLLVCLLVLSVMHGLLLPFTVRFGLMGIMLFMVAGQVLGIVFLLLARFLRPESRAFFSPLRAIFHGLRFLLGPESTAGHLLLVAAAVLLLNAGSLVLARALYARREM